MSCPNCATELENHSALEGGWCTICEEWWPGDILRDYQEEETGWRDSLSHLNRVLRNGGAPTQKAVLKSLLRGHDTGHRIAEDTNLSYNAVSIALHELAKHGTIQRVKRGTYKPKELLICLALMDSLTKMEKRGRRKEVGEID